MKKVGLVLSLLIFIAFTYFFTSNIIDQFDLFYVMWGAILLPVPISLVIFEKHNEKNTLGIVNFLLIIITLFVFMIWYYYPSVDTFDEMPDPRVRLIDIVGYITLIATTILSYISFLANYSRFTKKQVVTYIIIVPAFFFCYFTFGNSRTFEYVSGILLFLLICYNYFEILYSNIKKEV